MNLIESNKTVFFVSGMFAGSWTWDKCRHNIAGKHLLIKEPLMGSGNNVDLLVDAACEKLRSRPEPVTIIGNSLGGYVALAMAAELPEKVEQVLISGSAGFSKIEADIKDCLSRDRVAVLGQRLADLICYDKSKALDADKERLIADLTLHLRNMVGLLRGCNRIQAEDMLKNVSCPVKAYWGENDILSPFADAEPVLKKYNVECTVLPKSGHSPMYENPAEFAQWVNRCINELDVAERIAA